MSNTFTVNIIQAVNKLFEEKSSDSFIKSSSCKKIVKNLTTRRIFKNDVKCRNLFAIFFHVDTLIFTIVNHLDDTSTFFFFFN